MARRRRESGDLERARWGTHDTRARGGLARVGNFEEILGRFLHEPP